MKNLERILGLINWTNERESNQSKSLNSYLTIRLQNHKIFPHYVFYNATWGENFEVQYRRVWFMFENNLEVFFKKEIWANKQSKYSVGFSKHCFLYTQLKCNIKRHHFGNQKIGRALTFHHSNQGLIPFLWHSLQS